MGALLLEAWLGGGEALEILDEASVATLRQAVRERGSARGLSRDAVEALVTAASELGHNVLRHGHRPAAVQLRDVERHGVPGLEVIAADSGPGIERPEEALSGTAGSGRAGLGVGLAGVRRLVDELDIDVRVGEGSCLWARKFAAPGPRRREIGVFGRPCPDYEVSGDHAIFRRDKNRLLLAVIDGLGHGPEARDSAFAAGEIVRKASGPPGAIVADCERALRSMRGGVLGVLELDPDAGSARHAIVGDVRAVLVEPDRTRGLRATRGFLGRGASGVRIAEEQNPLGPRELACLCTDGVRGSADLGKLPQLLARAPIVIAAEVAARFGKDHDDLLVLVAR